MNSPRFVDVRSVSAEEVLELDHTYVAQSDVGAVFFSIFDASEVRSREFSDAYDRLNVFETWPSGRLVIVDEVSSKYFDIIFAEPPVALRDRCFSLLDLMRQRDVVLVRANGGSVRLRYDASSGTAYSGFEKYEYNLPSGEIAFRPVEVEGEVPFSGWLIGTIPFGQKYGRIRSGDLTLAFKGGRVMRIDGGNHSLVRDLDHVLSISSGLSEVNEFGVGLNNGVSRAAALSDVGFQWMEKSVGVHLGLGAELSEHVPNANVRRTHHHLDLVFDAGELLQDDGSLLEWSAPFLGRAPRAAGSTA